jgi:hypothetical protein
VVVLVFSPWVDWLDSPFAGISGLAALFGHAPRNIVILLGPHIGISQTGNVGKIERGATEGLSTACGAAIG